MLRAALKNKKLVTRPISTLDIGLTLQFKSLSLNVSSSRSPVSHSHFSKPLLFSRGFHRTLPFFAERDHLNERGGIREDLIEQRTQFLDTHGLLRDKIEFEGRNVYCNRHLFTSIDRDRSGVTNAQRMEKGLCPVTEDYDLVVIHHLDQSHGGDWVILTNHFHQTYDRQLHSKIMVENPVKRPEFQNEKKRFWKEQALEHKGHPRNSYKGHPKNISKR